MARFALQAKALGHTSAAQISLGAALITRGSDKCIGVGEVALVAEAKVVALISGLTETVYGSSGSEVEGEEAFVVLGDGSHYVKLSLSREISHFSAWRKKASGTYRGSNFLRVRRGAGARASLARSFLSRTSSTDPSGQIDRGRDDPSGQIDRGRDDPRYLAPGRWVTRDSVSSASLTRRSHSSRTIADGSGEEKILPSLVIV